MGGFPFRPSRRSLAGGFATGVMASTATRAAAAPAQTGTAGAPVIAVSSLRGNGGLAEIDVSAFPTGTSIVVLAEGYWQPGDGGGGRLYWDAESADPIDDFLVFAPRAGVTRGRWRRLADPSHLTFEMAGACGDGTTDDYNACQKLLKTAHDRFQQCRVLLQPGKAYLLDHSTAATNGFGVRLPSPNAGALVVPNHCVIEGPGGALGMTAQTVPEIGIAARLVLHPQMTIFLAYFAELRDLQIYRKDMHGPVDHFSPAGPASLEDMQAQLTLWLSEDGSRPEVNAGVRSVAITNGGVDTKVGRVLVMGFHTAYLSDGFGRPVIDELYFDTAGRGIEITRSADDALVRGCYSNAFWSSKLGITRNEHGDFGARPGIAYDFHDQCDGLRCVDCSAGGYATGFRLSNVWAVTLDAPNAEPAGQPSSVTTHGILAENSVSHTTILNPLIDGFTYKLDFQHRPFSQFVHTGPEGRAGPGQYGTASITVIGGSLQGNDRDPPGHRAIRLGRGSAGTVIAVNIAGFSRASAVLVEAGVGAWKFIALDPSLSVLQPQFAFADQTDRRKVLRLVCDPIDGSAPVQWSVEGPIVLRDLPTSSVGLPPGSLWRDHNDIKIV
jgi:hypothetical protein